MIKIKDLVKDYGIVKALKGISFEVDNGEIVGLLGPNGAGKTTAMRIVTGFIKPTSGHVSIDGHNVQKQLHEVQSRIGYLPETAPLYHDLSVFEHLELSAEAHGISGKDKDNAVKKTAELCGLNKRMYFDISELSKGYRQRVGLAQALIHDPKVLILDEPTTGLDPNQILEIRNLIKELGKKKTIVLSTHIMQEVEAVCSRVVLIKDGLVIADGGLGELKRHKTSNFQIKLSLKSGYEDIKHIIEKIEGVIEIKKVVSPERGVCNIIVGSEHDIRTEINKHMIKADIDVLEIALTESTMEEVFLDLTK